MDGKRTDTTKHDHATDYWIKKYKDNQGHPELQHLVIFRQNNNSSDDGGDNNNKKKINKIWKM